MTYLIAGGVDLKLDLYRPRVTSPTATPTLIYFHGGGWTSGSKDADALRALPYLEMGWAVVNVEYRLADVAHAPAAVEDCRCALRWVYRNAEAYNFDVEKIVVTGVSAGGHLALTTGMLPESAGLDRQCPGDRNRRWSTGTTSTEPLKVAAIINWSGITDVVGMIDREPGPSGVLHRGLAWEPDRPGGGSETCFTVDVRPAWFAAHSDDSRGGRPARSPRPGGSTAPRTRRRWRRERASLDPEC